MRPTISVIMPVLNSEKYLREAIDSVLCQTFKDFEFIIINDGSIDESERIIRSFKDSRIVYINNRVNLGLAESFNKGIDATRGKYIARMDADDISVKDRFEKQFLFLERNPYIGIVGSSIIIMNESGKCLMVHKRPERHVGIKFSSLFSSPMYHPTVMGRTKIFRNYHYNETFSNSEDYELWSRLLFDTDVRFANIKEPLLKYRIYPQSFTQTLNLDRRALSAHNTLKNIRHYVKLGEFSREFIIHYRQERFLGMAELIAGILVYLKSAILFCRKEHTGIRDSIEIMVRVLKFYTTLVKYEIRKILKI